MPYGETELIRQNRTGYFGVNAHGKDVFEHYPWISQILERLGRDGFLAKGTLQADDNIVWVTDIQGEYKRFLDLSPSDQEMTMKDIEYSVNLIREYAAKCTADEKPEEKERGRILNEIVGPSKEFIFVVDGKTVIAGWGLRLEGGIPSGEHF